MSASDEYLLEGARSELEPIAAALARAGIEARVGPPPADCAAPG